MSNPRESTPDMLPPELRTEATDYVGTMAVALGRLNAAIESGDRDGARRAMRTVRRAADALDLLLATGQSMRRE